MNFLKEKLDSLEERMLAITIIATFIISVFVFFEFWRKLINIVWVHPIMSKLYGHELLIAFVYGAIIAVYYYHKFKFTQYYNKNRKCYFGLLFFIYIICFFSKEWNFSLITDKTNFSAWTNLIFLVIIPEIRLYFVCKKREGINYNPLLEIEKTTEIEDAYQRNDGCESVYKIIKTCFFKEHSFAVGITGSWGSGKTTYINALKLGFKESKEDISIIDFEPWKNDSPSLIIKSFFALLKINLKPYISNISIPIDRYVSSLLDCDDVSIKTKLLLKTFYMFSMADKKSPYDQIKECLFTTKHRVVVFIDDIDRLDKSEIKEVLRLIRNTANFPYIQFIVAYDKDYIISALKDSGIESPTNYLEKFFNLEITLPMYENRIICSQLEKRLLEDMNELGFKDVDKTIHEMIYTQFKGDNDSTQRFLIPTILTNIRDVIRFKNSFYISIQMIKDLYFEKKLELEIEDLFYLELLRYRYNDVYMILRNRPTTILTYEKSDDKYNYNKDYLISINTNLFDIYNQSIITQILEYLFSGNNNKYNLCKRRYYSNYFMMRFDNKMFTEIDFMSLGGLTGIELSDKVEQMYEEKYEFEFKFQIGYILENIYKIDPSDEHVINYTSDYEYIYGILKAILKCAELKNDTLKKEISSAIISHLKQLSFYDANHLGAMLDLYNHLDLTVCTDNSFTGTLLFNILMTERLLFKSRSNIINCDVVIISFLEEVNDVVRMSNAITNFLGDIKNENTSKTQLQIDVPTLGQIRLGYFIHYNDKLSDNGFVLFSNCIDYENTSTKHIHKDALVVMKKEIEADPERYFSNFIQKRSLPDNKNILYPETYYLDIFGSNDEFESFIQAHQSIPSNVRVYRFFALYKYFNYQPLKFDNNINLDDMLTNNFEKEWNALLELLNLHQKYKNKEISEDEFNRANNLFNSKMQ